MRQPVASPTLERAVQVLVVGSIVTAVLAAGSLLDLLDDARRARWLFLFALGAAALLYAAPRLPEFRPRLPHLLAAALVALVLLSTLWSARPLPTFAHAVSLTVLLGTCAAVAIGAAERLESLRRVVDAVVAAAAAVAVGGLLVLAFAHDRAVQPASAQEAARYQGLGGGPNTATMLLAVAVPLAAYTVLESRTPGRRAVAVLVSLLVLGSIVASGSRGSLLASFAGLGVFAALAGRTLRARLVAVAAVAGLAVVAVALTQVPQPDPDVRALPGTALPPASFAPADGYLDANVIWRLQEDVGHAPWGQAAGESSRSLLGGSGRVQAWRGAIGLGAERPLLGYAFGTEDKVFVDRYLKHGSNQPENSYVGVFLQLGLVGLLLFAALVIALLADGWRAASRTQPRVGRLGAALAGAFAAGLVLALTQSYVYAAGSNATLAVWLCAFLLPAAAVTADVDAG